MSQEFSSEDRIEIIRRCKYLLIHHGRLFGRAQGVTIFCYQVENLQMSEFRPINKHETRTLKLHVLEGPTYPANQVADAVLYLEGDDPYRAEWSNLELAPWCLSVLRRHMVLEDLADA